MNRMNDRFKYLSKDDIAWMSKEEIIQRILSLMEHYTMQLKLFNDAYQMMKLYLEGQKSVHEARMLALSIHKMARMNPDSHQRLLYRAWGHAVASIHVKTHMIPMLNYLKKYHETKE